MKKRVIAIVLALSMLAFGTPAANVFADEGDSPSGDSIASAEYAPNRVLVLYEDGVVDTDLPDTAAEKKALRTAEREHRGSGFGTASESIGKEEVSETENTLGQQAEVLDASLGKDYSIEDTVVVEEENGKSDLVISAVSSDSMSTEQMLEKLSGANGIKIAEPDYICHTASMPDWDDTYLHDMHHLVGDTSIHADAVWESEAYAEANSNERTEPVVVAVVDTGVEYTHPDLKNRMWTKPESKAFEQFVGKYGYDFANSDHDPIDDNGHGTHCAGIIGAQANNAAGITGVAGISDKVKIMAVKALGADGSGYNSNIIAGMQYVTKMKKAGANICAISCSIGGDLSSEIFDAVIDAAGEEGILTIVAAGNASTNIDSNSVLPADAKSDYRVTVGAADENGSYASYSNYGVKNVDLVAPGSNILSTYSFYNYAPYLYDAKTIRGYTDVENREHEGNTEFYGEFDGAEVEETVNIQGELVETVKPVVGTDYSGKEINSAEDPQHQVGDFGNSVMLADRKDESEGKASLSLKSEHAFPVGTNQQYLNWNIEDAKPGDVYLLYFPYDKSVAFNEHADVNAAFRFQADEGQDGSAGRIEVGEIMINGVDRYGKLDWSNIYTDTAGKCGKAYTVDAARNSIWRASGAQNCLYPYSTVKPLVYHEAPDSSQQYGLGLVYRVSKGGNCNINISSLAISKENADRTTFGKYDVLSGTSMATPVVSGAVGTLKALYPELRAEELKNTLLSGTDDRFEGWCSTGGMLDLSRCEASPEESKPVINNANVDFEQGTVTLYGQGFGIAPLVTVLNNYSGTDEVPIGVNDISLVNGNIVISNAFEYGIIGSDISFYVENSENRKKGNGAFYVVNGLSPYDDGYRIPTNLKVRSNGPEAYELEFLRGSNQLLMYDPAGNIYRLVQTDSGMIPKQVGKDVLNGVNRYVASVLAEDLTKESLWQPALPVQEKTLDYYRIRRMSEPVYMGDIIYELIRADLGYRKATLLMGLPLNGTGEWTVYYDSLEGYGTEPDNLKWNQIDFTTLAAYKGRLYLFGSERMEEPYHTEEGFLDDGIDQKEEVMKMVFSCEPANPVTESVKWVQEEPLPAPRSHGVPVTQGGNLYYVFANSANDVDTTVYRFDGREWTEAGILPDVLRYSVKGGEKANYGSYTVSFPEYFGVSCAVGIDEKGILFGGASSDGAGDTFRFNTSSGEWEPLGDTLWGRSSLTDTTGIVADGKLWVQYNDDNDAMLIGKTIDIANDYVNLKAETSGDGSGTVSGGGTRSRNDASKIVIAPDEGCYIDSAVSNGLGQDINLMEITENYAQTVQERKEPVTANYDAMSDGTLDVVFGRISTEVNAEEKLSKEVGTYDLGFKTNGTISGVDLTSSKEEYAVVNEDGTVTFRPEGAGQKVTITAAAKDDPEVKAECVVTILEKTKESIADAVISGIMDKTYTGKAVTQDVTVELESKTLTEGTDYTVAYQDNVNAGRASVTINGKGDYTGSVTKTFQITPKKVTPQVVLSPTVMAYNGKAQKPAVTVMADGKKLASAGYDLLWSSGRKNVGIYNVTVTLKGNYSGSKLESFEITKAPNRISKIAPAGKKLKYKDVKKKARSFQLKAKNQFGTKMTFALDPKTPAAAKRFITVSKTGKVTVKKGTPRNVYTIRVKVSAKGTKNTNPASVIKKIKIKVQ